MQLRCALGWELGSMIPQMSYAMNICTRKKNTHTHALFSNLPELFAGSYHQLELDRITNYMRVQEIVPAYTTLQ